MAAGAPVLPREAIRFLQSKGLRPSRHWLSVFREEHATAFTVAQMTRQDMLRQTHRALVRALEKGETFEAFKKRLQPWLERQGWAPTGRGGDLPKRLERIYHTNLRAAHAAGQWDRIQRVKRDLPWLVYELGPSIEHREQHAAWAGLCLRVDDPWWKTHFPVNGWGCKCRVRQVAEPPEGAVTEAPELRTREWVNPATGEISDVPAGIDPGWDYNAAAHANVGATQALTDRLQRMAARTRPAVHDLAGPAARERLAEIAAEPRRRVAELEGELSRAWDAVNDPNAAITSTQLRRVGTLEGELEGARQAARAAERRAVLRLEPAPYRVSWGDERLRERWSAELRDWRRMVAPDRLRRVPPARVIEHPRPGEADASYATGVIRINRDMRDGVMVHELSHLLEADRDVLERAAAFLARRTRGDRIEAINPRGDRGLPDEFRDPEGAAMAYPGRIYRASGNSDFEGYHRATVGEHGDVYVTEVLTMGVEWMRDDPLGFAATDPDYFDFIWDTVIRAR